MSDVGRRLGVRYILDGAFQQAGDQIRITPNLIEADTGHTIWSERIVGLQSDLFDLQDRMAERVAAALEPSLLQAEFHRAMAKRPQDLRAYDLCMQVSPQVNRLTSFESYLAARKVLDPALSLDAGSVRAKAFLCRLTWLARSARWLSMDDTQFCLPLAESVAADPQNDALALAMIGVAIGFLGRQQYRGASILKQAYAMNPNSSHVLNASGWAHAYIGDNATAIDHFGRSIRINPLDPIIGQTRSGLGAALTFSGRVDEGLAALEQAYADAPEYTSTYVGLALAYWIAGRHDHVQRIGQSLLQREPIMTISAAVRDTPFLLDGHNVPLAEMLRFLGVPE